MNTTYQINAHFAVSKALDAVKSWDAALKAQQAKKDLEGIAFCERMLKGCQDHLATVREDVKNVQKWN